MTLQGKHLWDGRVSFTEQRKIELAKAPRMRPRTKHIDIQYHHFREAVQQKRTTIAYVSTHEQVADIATKPLPKGQFQYLKRKRLCGW
jgi:hypothetical protein